ncbi:MAG: peptidase [Calditrichaeota bacterium]|nr:MAG: peptidase [Calditrichota bacterium]
MKRTLKWIIVGFTIIAGFTGMGHYMISEGKPVIKNHADIEYVKKQLAKFKPVEIGTDLSRLSESDRRALMKLVQAAQLMDEIFLRQVYHKNVAIREALNNSDNPQFAFLKDYFDINFGPFDRLEGDKPFINLDEPKPKGANYYPVDMTREEFEQWLETHPEDREAFTGYFTVIRRKGDALVAVPYSEEYRELLEPAAKLLREAAELTDNPSLKKYLTSRAEAFLSNDYFQSDMDWMDLRDHDLEVVIGPYEVYEDGLFNYKAAFEAFLTVVNHEDGRKLQKVGQFLDAMERRLPIPDEHKNFRRGKSSPIVVVDEVYTAGDTKAGVQTIAFNLPNDERVREKKGSKKVMLKNVIRAKYENISIPIMQRVLAEKDLQRVSADAFFYHVLLHEMVHGLGPGTIVKDGRETTVSRELKETYSVLEEAKADVVGLYQFPFMIEQGVFDKELADKLYASFVGGIFRSIRFGIESAHGGANAITFNYLMEKGAIRYDSQTGRFSVNDEVIESAIRDLSHDILMLQALGDYEGAKAFLAKYRRLSPELKEALSRLDDVPVDIRPIYPIERELRPE